MKLDAKSLAKMVAEYRLWAVCDEFKTVRPRVNDTCGDCRASKYRHDIKALVTFAEEALKVTQP